MKTSSLSSKIINSVLVLVICLVTGLIASGQEKIDKGALKEAAKYKNKEFCSGDNWSSDNKESYRELRESTAPGGGLIDVDAGRNGGISVKGENRSDVLVRACVQAWGDTLDAPKAAVSSVSISTRNSISAMSSRSTPWSRQKRRASRMPSSEWSPPRPFATSWNSAAT